MLYHATHILQYNVEATSPHSYQHEIYGWVEKNMLESRKGFKNANFHAPDNSRVPNVENCSEFLPPAFTGQLSLTSCGYFTRGRVEKFCMKNLSV